jgi:hypothetical protein
MASKAKAKKKAAPKKAAPKRTTARKAAAKKPARKRPSKPKGPFYVVRNHRFAPGTKVGFYPAHTVEVERSMGREPMPSPTTTATVKARGLLEVSGLDSGQWCAAGPIGDSYAYVTFSVK